jgi:hypothetical protein
MSGKMTCCEEKRATGGCKVEGTVAGCAVPAAVGRLGIRHLAAVVTRYRDSPSNSHRDIQAAYDYYVDHDTTPTVTKQSCEPAHDGCCARAHPFRA